MFQSRLFFPLSPLKTDGNNILKNVKYFRQQWKYYCIVSGIDNSEESIKIAHLRLLIGHDANELIENELNLNEEEANNSEKLLDVIERYFSLTANIVHLRYLFNQLMQEENESIDDYLNKLQQLGNLCNFKNYTDEMIRDRFILGLKNQNIKSELISDNKLTLKKAISLCREAERKTNISSFKPELKRIKSEPLEDNCINNIKIVNTSTINHNFERILSSCNNPKGSDKIINNISTTTVSNSDNVVSTSTSMSNVSNNFIPGSFLLLKSDYSTGGLYPPIWKIDGATLLHKFMPFSDNNNTYYKNAGVYAAWNIANKDQYYPIKVKFKQQNRKEHIVQFEKDWIKIVSEE